MRDAGRPPQGGSARVRRRDLLLLLRALPARLRARPLRIDHLEVLGASPKTWRFNAHLDGADQGSNYAGPDTSTGWHTIGVWRKADRIEWFVDGKPTWSHSGPSVPASDVRTYVVLNLAVGGDWPGAPGCRHRFPAEMLVDYLRAWEPASAAAPSLAPANPRQGLWQPRGSRHLLVARAR